MKLHVGQLDRSRLIGTMFGWAVVLMTSQPIAAQASTDEATIRETIGMYFRAHATADSALMRRPFLPTAHIEGNREGRFVSWSLNEYVAGYKGVPARDEAQRSRRIDTIDISGDAAMVRATLDHGAVRFTDYFVLLKVGDQWRIANKVYYGARKP
jgi:hypothetical protein